MNANFYLNDQKANLEITKENIMRKFDAKLQCFLSCLVKADMDLMPKELKSYLRKLITLPKREDLTLMEANRLILNSFDGKLEQMTALEDSMLIGMYLFGKILTVKILLMPE